MITQSANDHSTFKWLAGLRFQRAGDVTAASEKSNDLNLAPNRLPDGVSTIGNVTIDKDGFTSKSYLRVSETYSSSHCV